MHACPARRAGPASRPRQAHCVESHKCVPLDVHHGPCRAELPIKTLYPPLNKGCQVPDVVVPRGCDHWVVRPQRSDAGRTAEDPQEPAQIVLPPLAIGPLPLGFGVCGLGFGVWLEVGCIFRALPLGGGGSAVGRGRPGQGSEQRSRGRSRAPRPQVPPRYGTIPRPPPLLSALHQTNPPRARPHQGGALRARLAWSAPCASRGATGPASGRAAAPAGAGHPGPARGGPRARPPPCPLARLPLRGPPLRPGRGAGGEGVKKGVTGTP
mmetsp:Transcript_10956/g.34821  ORF Transcript_10956/g.34821 Transcript_10956/m.34821 type:complete len:267 (+) Transcript_10956:405-1205(+)